MITFTQGNLLDSPAEALVNTVNTVGVMGKGIALQFKETYPLNYDAYRKACKLGEVRVGKMFVVTDSDIRGPRTIVNFPTKRHWRGKSQLEWIIDGLDDLRRIFEESTLKSIAIPPLGCGNGGLDWSTVKPLIEEKLADLPQQISIYEPNAFIKAQLREKQGADEGFTLNPARAMLLEAMHRYEDDFEPVSLFVANKLVYFLKQLGGPFDERVKFVKSYYGPYSPAVNHVVYRMNGHFVTGMEQNNVRPFETLELNNQRYGELKQYLQSIPEEQRQVLGRLENLLEGYKSAYSLEILATVAFIHQLHPNYGVEEIVNEAREWSSRKARLLKAEHVEKALERIGEYL